MNYTLQNIFDTLVEKRPFLNERINPPLNADIVIEKIHHLYKTNSKLNSAFEIYNTANGMSIDRNLNVPANYWSLFPGFSFIPFEETMEEITADYCGYGFINKNYFPLFTDFDIGFICFDTKDEEAPVKLIDSILGYYDISIFDTTPKFFESLQIFHTQIATFDESGLFTHSYTDYRTKMKQLNPKSEYWMEE